MSIHTCVTCLNLNYGMSTVPNWARREAKNELSHVRFFGKHVRFFRYHVRFFDQKNIYIECKMYLKSNETCIILYYVCVYQLIH